MIFFGLSILSSQSVLTCDISKGDVQFTSSSKLCYDENGIILPLPSDTTKINIVSQSLSSHSISIDLKIDIHLKNVHIASPSPISVSSATAHISFEGDNVFDSSSHAGIECNNGASIIFSATNNNAHLKTLGGPSRPGIGPNLNSNCQLIRILSGTIQATTKPNSGDNYYAAGIGAADCTAPNEAWVDTIDIQGGNIYATGQTGIGAADGGISMNNVSFVNQIFISGGNIYAKGITNDLNPSYTGAGIGAGRGEFADNSYVNLIRITGGNITAIGGPFASGIGAGQGIDGTDSAYVGKIEIIQTGKITKIYAKKGIQAQDSIGNGRKGILKTPLSLNGLQLDCTSIPDVCFYLHFPSAIFSRHLEKFQRSIRRIFLLFEYYLY